MDLASLYSHPDSVAQLKPEPSIGETKPDAQPEVSLTEKTYGNQGQPAASYAGAFGLTFDALAQTARENQDAEGVQAITEGQKATTSFLSEYQVSEVTAKDLVSTVEQYRQQPIVDDDAFEKAGEVAAAALQKEWGADYDKTLAGVRRFITEACDRLPWLEEYLLAGPANNTKFLRACAVIARQRGYV